MTETCSLVYRLEERYLDDDDDVMDQDLIITNFTPCKLASTSGLEMVVLNHMDISHIGDVGKFATLVSHVTEADLAWNSLSDWNTVSTMLKHLPLLRTLNLSHNPLQRDKENLDIPELPHLHNIVLNGTNLSFRVLQQLFSKMPRLSEVHLSENQFEPCDVLDPLSPSAKIIHLNRCDLRDWRQVERVLCRFPSRNTAFLVDNPIKDVKHETGLEKMSTLNLMNISKTNIDDWESIDNLSQLPGLFDLRITNVPLFEQFSDEERHHLVISRMSQLKHLNGSVITPELRETSERFFIRFYQDREDKPSHYDRLVQKHGNLERLVKVDLTPKTTAEVTVICEETNFREVLTINLNQKVGEFMKSIESKVGLKYIRMRMFHTNKYDSRNECRYHNLMMYSLKIDDEDIIDFESKVIHTRRRPLSGRSQ